MKHSHTHSLHSGAGALSDMGLVLRRKEEAGGGVLRMINAQVPTEIMGVDGITYQNGKWEKKNQGPDIFRSQKKKKYNQVILSFIQYYLFSYNQIWSELLHTVFCISYQSETWQRAIYEIKNLVLFITTISGMIF